MNIDILHHNRLICWCNRLGFPEIATQALVSIAETVKGDQELLAEFQNFYHKTSIKGEWHSEWSPLPIDPKVQARLGDKTSLYYLLAYLAALPHAEAEYRRRGIDLSIFDDTMSDICIWLCHHYETDGILGFDEFIWIWRHLACQLFRLGRLQFMLKPHEDGVTAYRNRSNGHVVLLADPEQPLRADGAAFGAGIRESEQTDPPPPDQPSPDAWYPVMQETVDGWRGHMISPFGMVETQPVCLDRREWQVILSPGDTVLDIHIPRKESFTVEDCRASLSQAYAFFAQQEPNRPFQALFCHTWFFTPQLQELLPPTSNILHFQREFYLYPFAGSPVFLWEYVFGKDKQDPALAPRNTSLQAAVLDWIAAGRELFDLPGLAFHGPQAWGSQPYMRAWEAGDRLAHQELSQE